MSSREIQRKQAEESVPYTVAVLSLFFRQRKLDQERDASFEEVRFVGDLDQEVYKHVENVGSSLEKNVSSSDSITARTSSGATGATF